MADLRKILGDLKIQLAADRKKAAVLGLLLIVLLFAGGRLLLSGGEVASTDASVALPVPGRNKTENLMRPVADPNGRRGATAVRKGEPGTPVNKAVRGTRKAHTVSVTDMPKTLARDLFTTAAWHKYGSIADAAEPEDQSANAQPDWLRRFGWKLSELQRSQKETVDRVHKEASELELQSTMTGFSRTAYISGPGFDRLVRVGDTIDGFSVLRIENRMVTLRKTGVTVTLAMQ